MITHIHNHQCHLFCDGQCTQYQKINKSNTGIWKSFKVTLWQCHKYSPSISSSHSSHNAPSSWTSSTFRNSIYELHLWQKTSSKNSWKKFFLSHWENISNATSLCKLENTVIYEISISALEIINFYFSNNFDQSTHKISISSGLLVTSYLKSQISNFLVIIDLKSFFIISKS